MNSEDGRQRLEPGLTAEAPEASLPPPFKPITINVENPDAGYGLFVVEQDGRNGGAMNFDEMLGQVISLTYRGGRRPQYPMHTPEEWQARAARHREKIEARQREEAATPVRLALGLDQARALQDGLSDLLCWCRGFCAARDDGSIPIGVEQCRRLNLQLKRAIREVETVNQRASTDDASEWDDAS